MKHFIFEVQFTGYANIRIEAETEEEAIALYNRGHYADSEYDMDDMFYDHEKYMIEQIENKIYQAQENQMLRVIGGLTT